MWGTNANTYCNPDADRYGYAHCNCSAEGYSFTASASHGAAPALRLASNGDLFGDSRVIASPRIAYVC